MPKTKRVLNCKNGKAWRTKRDAAIANPGRKITQCNCCKGWKPSGRS